MRTSSLLGLALAAGFAPPAWSQTNFDGTKQGFTWTGDCSTGVVFKNISGVDLCDLWVEIGNDGANNPPEIKDITVQGAGGGSDWDVDDNENGTDDDPGENDDADASPIVNPKGHHRAQAVHSTDCIPNGANFTVTICAVGNASLVGRDVWLWGTTHGASGNDGGDNGVKIADAPRKLGLDLPSAVTPIPSAHLPGARDFSVWLECDDLIHPMPRVQVVPADPDFDVLIVRADVPAVWDPLGHALTFATPLQPGEGTQLWFSLDQLSAVGPTTDVRLTRLGDPPRRYCQPKITSNGCAPTTVWQGSPSASSQQPFLVGCLQVINQRSGLLFYGYAPNSHPFQGGTLCVHSPLRRTPLQSSGGSPGNVSDCSGSFVQDFNARIQGGLDPQLAAGQLVCGQHWFRDPASPSTTGLSDALSFVIDL